MNSPSSLVGNGRNATTNRKTRVDSRIRLTAASLGPVGQSDPNDAEDLVRRLLKGVLL